MQYSPPTNSHSIFIPLEQGLRHDRQVPTDHHIPYSIFIPLDQRLRPHSVRLRHIEVEFYLHSITTRIKTSVLSNRLDRLCHSIVIPLEQGLRHFRCDPHGDHHWYSIVIPLEQGLRLSHSSMGLISYRILLSFH